MVQLCKPGDVIQGQKEGDVFVVKELLAKSAQWEIYKVAALQTNFVYTMKISTSSTELQEEKEKVALLNSNQDIFATRILPSPFSHDQCRIGEVNFSYYIADRCLGRQLNQYLGQLKDYEILFVFEELNKFLNLLERVGFACSELKPESILFDRNTQRISVVDLTAIEPVDQKGISISTSVDRNSWVFGQGTGRKNRRSDHLISEYSNGSKVGYLPTAGLKTLVTGDRGFGQNSYWNLGRVVYAIGVSSLLLFIGTVFYYYH